MTDSSANPVFVVLLFLLRCLVPLAILFGISYLLRKMGFVAAEAPEPPDESLDDDDLETVKIPNVDTTKKVSRKGGNNAPSEKTKIKVPRASGKSPGRKKPVEKPRSRSK